jgi:hypothetical protein
VTLGPESNSSQQRRSQPFRALIRPVARNGNKLGNLLGHLRNNLLVPINPLRGHLPECHHVVLTLFGPPFSTDL